VTNTARDRVVEWLDDEGFPIPMTPWGYQLYDDIRAVIAERDELAHRLTEYGTHGAIATEATARAQAMQERTRALQKLARVRRVADAVVASHADEVGTHYGECWRNHAPCLADLTIRTLKG
jgi:hypothetical protein